VHTALPAIAAALLITQPAHAAPAQAPPSAIFQQFGLQGTWSLDCSRGPTPDNPYVTWEVTPAGTVAHAITFNGESASQADTVSDAAIIDDNLISFTLDTASGVGFIVTVERAGGKMRTVRSVSTSGIVYYDNGRNLTSGRDSVFYERCNAVPPIS
jgi:hypothetical protein